MKITLIVLIFGFFATTFGNPVLQGGPVPDEIIDTIMDILRQVIKNQDNLDPLPLPTLTESFSEKVLGIRFHGKAQVYNGHLQGLSTIKRQGPTHLELINNESTLKLSTSLALDRLNAGYSGEASFMALKVSPSASASISNIHFDLETQACLQPGCSLQLTRFKIRDIGHINVRINGLGGLGRVLGPLTGAIANQIKSSLYKVIEGPIKNELSKVIREHVPDISELYSAIERIG